MIQMSTMRYPYCSDVDEIEKCPQARGQNCVRQVPQNLVVHLPLLPPLLLSFPWRTKQIRVHPQV